MHDLGLYVEDIVQKGFPEVAKAQISSSFCCVRCESYLVLERKTQFSYEILVDRSLKLAPQKVIIGGLAHEVAHLSQGIKIGPLLERLEGILYARLPLYTTFVERSVDRLVVERGFGVELLAFVKYHNKKREAYTFFDGLTEQEIRKLLKR